MRESFSFEPDNLIISGGSQQLQQVLNLPAVK